VAEIKFSEMPFADALVGSELIPVVQAGQNKTSTPFDLKTYVGVSGTNTGDETQTTIKTKLGQAASGVDGYLSGTDWDTFNSKSELVLGETSNTAYRGDRGKTAYDHSQTTGNPHGTTATDLGLGNVDNTSDANKPISTATQTALNDKEPTLANVITAGTYGSATQYPVITYNAKGIATNVTLQTVGAGVAVVQVSSGTVILEANKNYLILATNSFTLDVTALSVGYSVEIRSLRASNTSSLNVSLIGAACTNEYGNALTTLVMYPASVAYLRLSGSSVVVKRANVTTVADFALRQTGSATNRVEYNLNALTALVSHTYPNANIDFGTLSSVATTDGNVLSAGHTRCRIVGGQNNTVGGTDNTVINSIGVQKSGQRQTAINVRNSSGVTWNGHVQLGGGFTSSLGTEVVTHLVKGNFTGTQTLTEDGGTISAINVPKAVLTSSQSSAIHVIELRIETLGVFGIIGVRNTQYRIGALNALSITAGTAVQSVANNDVGTVDASVVSVTIDTTNNRLVISVQNVAATGLNACATVHSFYTTA
jgi:hypothetical protein